MSSALVSPRFPEGLRVLLVDDDLVCLENMNQMLEECRYQVAKFSQVDDALTQLRQSTNKFDIMITDVRISDMNDQQLMEVALQMDIPVILTSAADEDMKRIIKGVARGAHYLVKPVTMKTVRSIWQHVVRKRKHLWKDLEVEVQSSEDDDAQEKSPESSDSNSNGSKRKMTMPDENGDNNNKGGEPPELDNHITPPTKKSRVVWSADLHQQFVAAVEKLGIDKAVPKKILESMNVPELTRENVASHLQKYRLYLRRQEAQVQGTSMNQQTSYQVAADRLSATQTSYRSSATHEYNAKQQHHVIPQQQPSYFGGTQQFSMIQSSFGNLIVTHRDVSGFNTGISASTSIRTAAGGVGCSAIMNGLPRMINYHQPSNEMALLSLNNHNLITADVVANNYSDPTYNTFSHITSVGLELQNNIFDDYHPENSILPNYFHAGEENDNLVGPAVDNPKPESLLMVSQFYSEHPQWNQSYSAQKMQ